MKSLRFPLLSVLLITLITLTANAQIGYSPKIDSLINLITTQSVGLLDRQLSGDTTCIIGGSVYTIASRHYNSVHNPKAAQYIFELLQSYGYTPRYQYNSATSVNVLATKLGTKYPNQYYIIGGHYDDMPSGSLAPGADDNASGTVGVLEAARILAGFPTEYTVVFALWDEEERGLYGSDAYVDTAYFRGDSILCNINLDMIAYDGNNDGKNEVVSNTASESFANDYISAMRTYLPTLVPIKKINTTANSDHASFWTRGYKGFMNIEDNSDFTPYYHTTNDKYSTLNLPFFRNLVRTAIAALVSFSNNVKMDFYHTQLASGNYMTDRTAALVIKSKSKVAMNTNNAPRLYYKVNNGSYTSVNYDYYNLDTFKFIIPAQTTLGTVVNYYFAAQDSAGSFICTYPAGGRGLNPPGSTAPTTTFSYTIESVNYACIGTGTTPTSYPFYTLYEDSRTQILFNASEIVTSGGSAGLISKLGFNYLTVGSPSMSSFSIKMQTVTASTISTWTTTGWTEVYTSSSFTPPGTGIQYINLANPYYWNGTGNLLIEVCFDNTSWSANSTVAGTSQTGTVVHHHVDGGSGCTVTSTSTAATRPNICLGINTATSIGNNQTGLPNAYSLSQNYPNPFNPVTKINFAIPRNSFVTLKVYDMLGKEIANLVNGSKEAGYYTVDFSGTDLSTGVYYYRLESEGFVDVKKMILIK